MCTGDGEDNLSCVAVRIWLDIDRREHDQHDLQNVELWNATWAISANWNIIAIPGVSISSITPWNLLHNMHKLVLSSTNLCMV